MITIRSMTVNRLVSLKKSWQPANGKSREQGYDHEHGRNGRIKFLARNYAGCHRDQARDNDENDRVLANCAAPFSEPEFRVGIAPALTKRPPAQGRESGKDEREIAEIENDCVAGDYETQEGLDRVRHNRNPKKKDEINKNVGYLRHEVVAKNPVMREPDHANNHEGDDECAPSGGFEHVGRIGRDIETNAEERKAKTEDQIAERFQPMGETFAKHRRNRRGH